MIVCLPGLRREYLHLVPQIGQALETYIATPRMAASVAAKAIGLPITRVIDLDPTQLPKEI